jgi:hypothetical protein
VTALNDRDRRALAEIARQVRTDDRDFAALLTGPPPAPELDWTPVYLRALAVLLLAVGVLMSATLLVLVALGVYGLAQLCRIPVLHRSTTAGRDGSGSR